MQRTEEFRRFKTEVQQKRQIKLFKKYNPSTKLTDRTIGRFRRHSYCDCGVPKCPMCSNPRHNKLFSTKDQLTVKEQIWIEQYKQELKELADKKDQPDDVAYE